MSTLKHTAILSLLFLILFACSEYAAEQMSLPIWEIVSGCDLDEVREDGTLVCDAVYSWPQEKKENINKIVAYFLYVWKFLVIVLAAYLAVLIMKRRNSLSA